MIKIKRITKKYGERIVLDISNIVLPSSGFVLIHGPSGSGKTTFANSLAGLSDFEGEIEINNKDISKLSDNEKDEFRLRNFGFVFQDFKLFENDTVFNNIDLVYSSSYLSTAAATRHRINDILHLVKISHKGKAIVNTLSGGEKQRVAIARSIVNEPSIVICDEPTGALDSKNSKVIMEILKMISKTSLVLVISHDFDLVNNYAEQVIELKDGKIVEHLVKDNDSKQSKLPLPRPFKNPKKTRLPFNFFFNYSRQIIRKTKWRTLVNNLILSFGLLSFGFSFILQDSISQVINNSYSDLIDQRRVFIEPKSAYHSLDKESSSYLEAKEIMKAHKDTVNDVGVLYETNFENNFKDQNSFTLVSGGLLIPLPTYSIRNINDYEWLDSINSPVYPREFNVMEDDEVIIALGLSDIEHVCRRLNIAESIVSFSNYLLKKQIQICIEVRNSSWEYSDQQIVRLKGFVIGDVPTIYNDNPLWNQYFFEERMRFPSTHIISEEPVFPWTMKKIHYLKVFKDIELAVEELRFSKVVKNKIIEIPNKKHYPLGMNKQDRLLIFKNKTSSIEISDVEKMRESTGYKNAIYGTRGGYFLFPDSFIEGFSRRMIMSSSESQLESAIEGYTFSDLKTKDKIVLPKGLLSCYFTDALENGITLKTDVETLAYGGEATKLNEIVISKNVAESLFGYINCVNQKIHYSYVFSEINKGDRIERIFKNGELIVSGVSDSNKNVIYQKSSWSLLFFQVYLGVSAFDLIPTTASFTFDNYQDAKEKMNFLSSNFPEYHFSHPYESIKGSVKETTDYLNFFVLLMSYITMAISFVFIALLDYLYVIENKKALGLLRCLGINKKEGKKTIVSYSLLLAIISFVASSICLLVYSFYSQIVFTSFMTLVTAVLSMFVVSVFLAIVPALLVLKRLERKNIIESLKN